MDHAYISACVAQDSNSDLAYEQLLSAIYNDRIEVARSVFAQSVAIDFESPQYRDLWHSVLELKHCEFISLFLKHGALPNVLFPVENNGLPYAPLSVAFSFCDVASAQLLIDHGADYKFAVAPGKTVLCGCINWLITEADAGFDVAAYLEILRLMLHSAPFRQVHKEVSNLSRQRIKTALLTFNRFRVPTVVVPKILAYVPEDICSPGQLRYVLYDAGMKDLLAQCPLAWFKMVYQKLPDKKKRRFINKVVPGVAQYRLNSMQAVLSAQAFKELDISSLDPKLIALLDSGNVEQHRAAIMQNIMKAFVDLSGD